MDEERFGELVKGRIDAAAEEARQREAEERIKAEAQSNGSAILEETKDMWRRCESFWKMLEPEGSIIGGDFHGATEKPHSTLYKLGVGLGSQSILLARDQEIEGVGKGNLVGAIMPGGSSRDGAAGDFYLVIGIVDEENHSLYPSPAQKHGTWGLQVGANALFEAASRGRDFKPGENYDYGWTPENVDAAQAHLDETGSELDSTLEWMLEAACDPELNPDVAERAQVYRDSLQAVA